MHSAQSVGGSDRQTRGCRYFALIIRAISVLEGIALVGNDDFAIIDEAYPYLAQRLLTDDSPRLRESLKYMIYGRSGVFDAERLIDLLSAFETFTVNSRSAAGNLAALPAPTAPAMPSLPQLPSPFPPTQVGAPALAALWPPAPLALGVANERSLSSAAASTSGGLSSATSWQSFGGDPNNTGARAALLFLLADEGAFFREFLMDEIVCSIDALSREQVAHLVHRLQLSSVQMPVFLPGAKVSAISLAPDVSDEDRKQVESVAKLVEFFAGQSASDLMSGASAGLLPLMPRVAQQIVPEVSRRLISRITARAVRTFYL